MRNGKFGPKFLSNNLQNWVISSVRIDKHLYFIDACASACSACPSPDLLILTLCLCLPMTFVKRAFSWLLVYQAGDRRAVSRYQKTAVVAGLRHLNYALLAAGSLDKALAHICALTSLRPLPPRVALSMAPCHLPTGARLCHEQLAGKRRPLLDGACLLACYHSPSPSVSFLVCAGACQCHARAPALSGEIPVQAAGGQEKALAGWRPHAPLARGAAVPRNHGVGPHPRFLRDRPLCSAH